MDLLSEKILAVDSDQYAKIARAFSEAMLHAYYAYVARTRMKLKSLRPSSKNFWKISKGLLNKPDSVACIPTLKRDDGGWARTAREKRHRISE